jgi:hypothetical protein
MKFSLSVLFVCLTASCAGYRGHPAESPVVTTAAFKSAAAQNSARADAAADHAERRELHDSSQTDHSIEVSHTYVLTRGQDAILIVSRIDPDVSGASGTSDASASSREQASAIDPP